MDENADLCEVICDESAYISKTLLYNDKGKIVACLYILKDGNLHIDSWIKPKQE